MATTGHPLVRSLREAGELDYQQSRCSLGLHHRLPHTVNLSDGRTVRIEKEGPQSHFGELVLSSNRWLHRRYRTELPAVRRSAQ